MNIKDRIPRIRAAGRRLSRNMLVLAGCVMAIGLQAACAQAAPATAEDADGRHVISVSSVNQLKEAMAAARGTALILLEPGNYPLVDIRDMTAAGDVVVASADPARPALLSALQLRNVSGFTFRNFVLARYMEEPRAGNYLLLVMSSQDVTIEDFTFRGLNQAFDPGILAAAMLRDSESITFARNGFSYFRHGLELLDVDDMKIVLNEFTHMQTDAIRGGGISNSLFANNVMTEFYPAPGDHPDGIQVWSTNQKEPGRNLLFRENLLVRGKGGHVQGIFVRDTFNQLPFENIEIIDNLIIGSLYNGIMIDGVNTARIANNEVVSDPRQQTWIRLNRGRDVVLEGNRAERYVLEANRGAVRETNNRRIARSDKELPARIRAWVESREGFAEYRGPLLRSLMAEPVTGQ